MARTSRGDIAFVRAWRNDGFRGCTLVRGAFAVTVLCHDGTADALRRVGLDHFAMRVVDRKELEAWSITSTHRTSRSSLPVCSGTIRIAPDTATPSALRPVWFPYTIQLDGPRR